MVQAIKTFMECSMISNRHNYKEISARFRRLDLELEAMLDRPYDRGLFEQIVEPLRTLWITLLELGQSRRWHVVSTNTHIARYPDSDLEVTDSLDDVVEGIDHWQNYFPNNPMVVSWYLGLVERHAARFLATENIKIVDQLMKILSWIRFSLRKYLEDEMLAKKLWEVWIKCMQRFCKQNADFRDLHRAVRIYDKVQDEYCVDNARIFYETLRDEGISDDVVCLGLHRATMTLRNRTIGTPVKVESSLTKTSVDTTKVRVRTSFSVQ